MNNTLLSPWVGFFIVACGILIICSILREIIKKRIPETHGLMWLIPSVFIVIGGCFPQIIMAIANWLDVGYAPTMIFTFAILLLFYLVFRCTIWIAGISMKIQELGMQVSLLNQENARLNQSLRSAPCEAVTEAGVETQDET